MFYFSLMLLLVSLCTVECTSYVQSAYRVLSYHSLCNECTSYVQSKETAQLLETFCENHTLNNSRCCIEKGTSHIIGYVLFYSF